MLASAWFRILWHNGFAISPSRLPFAAVITFYAIINSGLGLIQKLVFGRRISNTSIDSSPIFIVGHWRAGTTLIHELLALDPRLAAPTTVDCFAPSHVLLTGWLLRRLPFLLPKGRPMDNMRVGWDRPQEDEFALINLGYGSPYEMLVFPNRRGAGHPFLGLRDLPPSQVAAWKSGLLHFIRQVTLRACRERSGSSLPRLVLKSPPHTARLRILKELFPNARFVHVVRHPVDLFVSTMGLWHALCRTHGLQRPEFGAIGSTPAMRDHVLETMNLLYRDFSAAVAEIPPRHFCEVRYEDLVQAPMRELRRIYEQLELGSFTKVETRVTAHLETIAEYRRNDHLISDRDRMDVVKHWAWYFERYGYEYPNPSLQRHRRTR
ncbi:MAG: sulfotransferase [Xanthobacteraceae bacterium]|nr:sulfotransferase [Xanthobacteraceae bacterium]MBV9630626.1 sulfotransferase [Xanthobacteraceae bacterium]